MGSPPAFTTSQVNKAGRIVRLYYAERRDWDKTLGRAIALLREFRAAHQYPLGKANMGLRSTLRTCGCNGIVSQRLKRFWTIVDKLEREPTMALSRMQDIGGCRAVLTSIEEIRAVEHRLRRNRLPLAVYDYISHPRSSGYRAVHVVVGYEDRLGQRRAIEVQLRTRTMHEWAFTVERLSGRLREDLKSGKGHQQVLDWLASISEAMAIEETGGIVPGELIALIEERRIAAVPFLLRSA